MAGHPSGRAQVSFPLPDHWRNDPSLNRGVYENEIPVGNDRCRVTVVTRGEIAGGLRTILGGATVTQR